jgi:hypothetical protein
MNPRALALSLALALPAGIALSPDTPLEGARPAAASTSILVSLESLVQSSTFVVVATAGDKTSVWEDSPTGRRIVTYTKLAVERAVVGSPGAEIWVRTLGGAVGSIGQSVSGEAQLAKGSRSLLFLRKVDGAVVVTAMAQGHFPILPGDVIKGTPPKLAPSPDAGTLLPRRGPSISARERLVGVTLDEALAAVKQVPRGADEKK